MKLTTLGYTNRSRCQVKDESNNYTITFFRVQKSLFIDLYL